MTLTLLLRLLVLWVCLSIVVAALFGAIRTHGKRRFKRALLRRERKVDVPQGGVQL